MLVVEQPHKANHISRKTNSKFIYLMSRFTLLQVSMKSQVNSMKNSRKTCKRLVPVAN